MNELIDQLAINSVFFCEINFHLILATLLAIRFHHNSYANSFDFSHLRLHPVHSAVIILCWNTLVNPLGTNMSGLQSSLCFTWSLSRILSPHINLLHLFSRFIRNKLDCCPGVSTYQNHCYLKPILNPPQLLSLRTTATHKTLYTPAAQSLWWGLNTTKIHMEIRRFSCVQTFYTTRKFWPLSLHYLYHHHSVVVVSCRHCRVLLLPIRPWRLLFVRGIKLTFWKGCEGVVVKSRLNLTVHVSLIKSWLIEPMSVQSCY